MICSLLGRHSKAVTPKREKVRENIVYNSPTCTTVYNLYLHVLTYFIIIIIINIVNLAEFMSILMLLVYLICVSKYLNSFFVPGRGVW